MLPSCPMLPHRQSLPGKVRRAGLRALVLLLCFAAWRGPLPWIHEHHAEQPGTDADGRLARHLVHYHAGQNPASLLWHVHFVIFWDGLPDEDSDNKSPHAQDPLLTSAVSDVGSTAVSDWDGQVGVVDIVADTRQHGAALTEASATCERAHSFLATLLATAPLRAVTGV